MFKNRAVQITLAKNDGTAPAEKKSIDNETVVYWNAVILSNAEALGKGLIVLYAAKKAIDTASVLIINASKLA